MSGGNPNHGYHGQFSSGGGSSSSAEAAEKSTGGTRSGWVNPYAAAAGKAAPGSYSPPTGLGNTKAIAAANKATRTADKFAHHAQHLPPKPPHQKAPKAAPKVHVTHRTGSSLETKVPHMATPAHHAAPAPKLPAKSPLHAVAAGHKAAVSPVHHRTAVLPAKPKSSALGLHHGGAPKAPAKPHSAHHLITVSAAGGRTTHPHAPVHRSPVHHVTHQVAKKNPTPAGLRGGGTASVGFGRSSSGGGSRAGGGRGRMKH